MVKLHLLVLSLVVCQGVLGEGELHIKNASDLISFSRNVNPGTTTVFLDADIDLSGNLSEQFEPIYFQGTFDGQGHTISNLAINSSSSQFAGLFGYSEDATIRNVVLDSSCSVVSSYSGSYYAYIGGVIGYCQAFEGPCVIENTVNMASVSFTGNITRELYFGGIVGLLSASNKEATVRNCANYGSVTHFGTASNARIGGIVGYSYGSSPNKVFIQNCLNYGTINHNGTTTGSLFIGGILGYSASGTNNIENCVSGGKITSNKASNYIGSVVGYVKSSLFTSITHCYWSSDDGYSKACGKGSPTVTESTSFNSTTFELSKTISAGNYTGTSLLDALNAAADHYVLRDYSHWLLNKDNKEVSFTVNNRVKPLTLSAQLILLPSLASEGKLWFDGWYNDSSCTKPLIDFEITSDTPLYGKWEENNNKYTITFDTRGGSPVPEPITEQFGSIVQLLSNVYREHCEFKWWGNGYGDKAPFNFTVPARNITLHAVWLCTHITTVEDFIDFSKIVNSGTNYSGTTVFLDADIDLSGGLFEQFEFISYYEPRNDMYFRGTFDGQGHTISNLEMNSSDYVGLFGYSDGATIRNAVLDSSCSVVSFYSGSDKAFVGGIVGYCSGCTIENTVNMASASFTGSTNYGDLYLGGIAGYLYYPVTIKNCANYGSVTHSGTVSYANIGGIAGYSKGSTSPKYIQNCLNYGTITCNGTTSNILYIGGILGCAYSGTIILENCVSGGKITSSEEDECYAGSLVGSASLATTITHCYWTSDVGYSKAYGDGIPIGIAPLVSLNTTTMDKLNSYNSSWSRWFMLHLNGGNINSLNQPSLVVTQKHFPDPVKEGSTFLFWCLDTNCNEKYDPKTTDITKVTGLYAKFDSTHGGSGSRIHSEGDNSKCDGSFSLHTAPFFVLVALLL